MKVPSDHEELKEADIRKDTEQSEVSKTASIDAEPEVVAKKEVPCTSGKALNLLLHI